MAHLLDQRPRASARTSFETQIVLSTGVCIEMVIGTGFRCVRASVYVLLLEFNMAPRNKNYMLIFQVNMFQV